MRASLCLLISLLSVHTIAAELSRDAIYELDIPRTNRVKALSELSRQANGLHLDYASDDSSRGRTLIGPIKGRFTLDDALRIILRDSGLTYRITGTNKLLIEPGSRQRQTRRFAKRTLQGIASRAAAPAAKAVEEVIVSSSQVAGWSMAPVAVLEHDQLRAIGASTLSDALRYIPQSAFSRPEGYYTSGAQYAEMRGLGSDTALILINGRRVMPSASSLTSSAFDLNTIPMAAVERIEFSLDQAAVEYGTDAIGGVINIVLRESESDPTVELRHDGARGGAEQRRGTLRIGSRGERFNSALTLSHFDGGGLLGGERDLWRNQDFRRFGHKDQRSLFSSVGNIASTDGRHLPGLAAPIAAVPLVDTTPGISREDFIATAGSSHRESLFRYWSVVPDSKRTSVVANTSSEVGDSLVLSAEALHVERNSTFFFFPPTLPGLPVAASNAFNPFGITVLTYRSIPELGTQYQYMESELTRAATELQGRWARWEWSISTLYSHEQASTWIHNELDLSADGAVMRALSSPDPAQALNPFQSGPIGDEALLRSLVAPRQVDNFTSVGQQVAAYLAGPLFHTSAGALTTTLGAEWRRESATFESNDMGGFDGGRDVRSAFVNLHLPLVSENMGVPAILGLSLTAGSRLDQYEGMDRVIRSQGKLQWNPLRALNVRAAAGRSFRPPSLYELYMPKIAAPSGVRDPARDNEVANITVVVGGNDKLQAATAKTFTAGLELAPDSTWNWKLSADYWRVTMDDRVSAFSAATLLAHESLFSEHITRDDQGILQAVDTSRINAGRVSVSGVDFFAGADLSTPVGNFIPGLRATWFDSFLATDIPGQPAVERVNLASELGSILKWRAILSLAWVRGPYRLSTAARYSPSYNDAIGGVRTGGKVASQTLLDLHCSIDFGQLSGAQSPWSGLNLAIGAFNVFNVEPSVAEVGGAADFDLSQGDLKQGSYYLHVEKQF